MNDVSTTSPDTGFDRFLDRTVVLGYSRIGYAIRRRAWDPHDLAPQTLRGKTALVTGAGSGLGEATALGLARLGAHVHLVVRSRERAEPAVKRIRETLERESIIADLSIDVCDVSDPDSIESYAAQWVGQRQHEGAIDILVHNAGVMPPKRTESVNGHELTVATHVLGPILLTERLLPVLANSDGGARVIFVASGGMYTQRLVLEDPEYVLSDYSPTVAYARSKRMQVELVPVLNARWRNHGVSVHGMHPGWADTPGVEQSLPAFRRLTQVILRSTEAGADTAVWLAATRATPRPGGFWNDRKERPTSYRSSTRPAADDVEKLWRWVANMLHLEASVAE